MANTYPNQPTQGYLGTGPNTITGAGTPAGGFTVAAPVGTTYTLSASSGIMSSELKALTPFNPFELQWTPSPDENIVVYLREYDTASGQTLRAEFAPEGDMTPLEGVRISTLFFALNGRAPSNHPISYLRRHNLLRHFKLTTV